MPPKGHHFIPRLRLQYFVGNDNGPAVGSHKLTVAPGLVTETTSNWSGYVVVDGTAFGVEPARLAPT
jgi:hypothetical protein